MGSPDFALPTLKTLHKEYGVASVLTRPDAPKGRGKKLTPTPIKTWAEEHNIPVYTPQNKAEVEAQLNELKPSLCVVIAYGMILPKSITDAIPCINLHGSILPQYRGASPIHASLLNNDAKTGITAIHMNEKMDEGDILHINTLQITEDDTLQTLHDSLSELSAKTIIDAIDTTETPSPQNHTSATYCQKLTTEDRKINSDDTPEINYGKIRAFSPKPGAFIEVDGKKIKIIKASINGDTLTPLIVQPEGKGAMPYSDFLLGNQEIEL
jgi:methionyl-tRNA formyltransferase